MVDTRGDFGLDLARAARRTPLLGLMPRMLLLEILDIAGPASTDEAGTVCAWASQAELARRYRIAERTVRYHIQTLVQAGFLKTRRKYPGGPNYNYIGPTWIAEAKRIKDEDAKKRRSGKGAATEDRLGDCQPTGNRVANPPAMDLPEDRQGSCQITGKGVAVPQVTGYPDNCEDNHEEEPRTTTTNQNHEEELRSEVEPEQDGDGGPISFEAWRAARDAAKGISAFEAWRRYEEAEAAKQGRKPQIVWSQEEAEVWEALYPAA